MDYKEKYNELVEAIKVLQEENPSDEGIQNWVNDNVPELAESQDEKVRKWVYNYFRSCFPTWIHPDITCGEILDWLEKQGQKPDLKESDETAKAFARIIRANLTGIDRDVQYKFEQLYKEITGKKMYQGYKD